MMITQGQTTHFVVKYDASLTGGPGQQTGAQLAQTVLDYCEYDFARLSALFGGVLPEPQHLPFTISIIPAPLGQGGASNDTVSNITCLYNPDEITLYGSGLNPLIVAEEAEIFMVIQNKGWDPGWSDGEALSRVSVQVLYPQSSWLFSTGTKWFNEGTYTDPVDWVDDVEQTDQDEVATGCGSLFFNYLAYQLNHTWPTIIGAGAQSTHALAETASVLGDAGGYPAFLELLQANFPTGDLYPATTPYDLQTDDLFPLGQLPAPALYMRHNTADDGTSHLPPLGQSPDIIVRNNQVADPQATFSSAASIASATESDRFVLGDQTNYLYLRAWNRGEQAQNVFATVYWSPPATLVTPPMWNLIGTTYYPEIPVDGEPVQVSVPGIPWPESQVPSTGHYCFVAAVGNNYQPAPTPASLSFATFDAYVDYILANNNITWRNFNVVEIDFGRIKGPFGGLFGLPFQISGAWDHEHTFHLGTVADLPEGSVLALQVPRWLGRGLDPVPDRLEVFEDLETDPTHPQRVRAHLPVKESHRLGQIKLPTGTAAASHLLVHIPPERHDRPFDIAIRQLYKGHEVGRITWRLVPKS